MARVLEGENAQVQDQERAQQHRDHDDAEQQDQDEGGEPGHSRMPPRIGCGPKLRLCWRLAVRVNSLRLEPRPILWRRITDSLS